MIGRGRSIGHTGNALNYAEQKLEAKEVYRQYVSGEKSQDIEKEFGVTQEMNGDCQKNTLAFVVSPAIPDGQKLTDRDWEGITKDFLEKMELTEHQAVAYVHEDREHKHLHIYVNRVDFEGKAYNDSFVSNKASRTAEAIAHERGLIQAKEVQKQKALEKVPEQAQVMEIHHQVMKQAPRGIQEYKAQMEAKGVEVHLKHDSKGKLVGVSYQPEGAEKVKASDLDRSLAGGKIEKTLADNYKAVQQEKAQQQQRQQTITRSRDRDNGMSL